MLKRSHRVLALSEIVVCARGFMLKILIENKFNAHFRRELEAFCRQVDGK